MKLFVHDSTLSSQSLFSVYLVECYCKYSLHTLAVTMKIHALAAAAARIADCLLYVHHCAK
jgi:hypothetical protein